MSNLVQPNQFTQTAGDEKVPATGFINVRGKVISEEGGTFPISNYGVPITDGRNGLETHLTMVMDEGGTEAVAQRIKELIVSGAIILDFKVNTANPKYAHLKQSNGSAEDYSKM